LSVVGIHGYTDGGRRSGMRRSSTSHEESGYHPVRRPDGQETQIEGATTPI
jgi:hypothetical protein